MKRRKMTLNSQTPIPESRLVAQPAEGGQWQGSCCLSHLTEHGRAWDTSACLYRQGQEELTQLSLLNKDGCRSKNC